MVVETSLQRAPIGRGAWGIGINTFHKRARSGATKVSTTSANVPGARSKLDNLLGCSPNNPEVDPTIGLTGPRQQVSQPKSKMPARGIPRCFPAATQV